MNNENKKLLVLISKGVSDRKQASNQKRALNVLDGKRVLYDTVNGMDTSQRERRDELFEISGVRGNYPQFFWVSSNGDTEEHTTTYIGDWDYIEALNDVSQDLDEKILEQNPQIETFEKVFGHLMRDPEQAQDFVDNSPSIKPSRYQTKKNNTETGAASYEGFSEPRPSNHSTLKSSLKANKYGAEPETTDLQPAPKLMKLKSLSTMMPSTNKSVLKSSLKSNTYRTSPDSSPESSPYNSSDEEETPGKLPLKSSLMKRSKYSPGNSPYNSDSGNKTSAPGHNNGTGLKSSLMKHTKYSPGNSPYNSDSEGSFSSPEDDVLGLKSSLRSSNKYNTSQMNSPYNSGSERGSERSDTPNTFKKKTSTAKLDERNAGKYGSIAATANVTALRRNSNSSETGNRGVQRKVLPQRRSMTKKMPEVNRSALKSSSSLIIDNSDSEESQDSGDESQSHSHARSHTGGLIKRRSMTKKMPSANQAALKLNSSLRTLKSDSEESCEVNDSNRDSTLSDTPNTFKKKTSTAKLDERNAGKYGSIAATANVTALRRNSNNSETGNRGVQRGILPQSQGSSGQKDNSNSDGSQPSHPNDMVKLKSLTTRMPSANKSALNSSLRTEKSDSEESCETKDSIKDSTLSDTPNKFKKKTSTAKLDERSAGKYGSIAATANVTALRRNSMNSKTNNSSIENHDVSQPSHPNDLVKLTSLTKRMPSVNKSALEAPLRTDNSDSEESYYDANDSIKDSTLSDTPNTFKKKSSTAKIDERTADKYGSLAATANVTALRRNSNNSKTSDVSQSSHPNDMVKLKSLTTRMPSANKSALKASQRTNTTDSFSDSSSNSSSYDSSHYDSENSEANNKLPLRSSLMKHNKYSTGNSPYNSGSERDSERGSERGSEMTSGRDSALSGSTVVTSNTPRTFMRRSSTKMIDEKNAHKYGSIAAEANKKALDKVRKASEYDAAQNHANNISTEPIPRSPRTSMSSNNPADILDDILGGSYDLSKKKNDEEGLAHRNFPMKDNLTNNDYSYHDNDDEEDEDSDDGRLDPKYLKSQIEAEMRAEQARNFRHDHPYTTMNPREKLYLVEVDTRGTTHGNISCFQEKKCTVDFFQNKIVNNKNVTRYESHVAKLCGLSIKLYFQKYQTGLAKYYDLAGEEGCHSLLQENPDYFSRNNGAATLLTVNPENGLSEYLVEGKTYVVRDDGRYPLSRGQVWGIQEMVDCCNNIFDMDEQNMKAGREAYEKWTMEYQNGLWVPPTGCNGIDIYSSRDTSVFATNHDNREVEKSKNSSRSSSRQVEKSRNRSSGIMLFKSCFPAKGNKRKSRVSNSMHGERQM